MIGTTFNQLCKLIFAIFALLILPNTTWAARYTTSGNVTQGTGTNVYNWTINNTSGEWLISYVTYSYVNNTSSGKLSLSFEQSVNVTLKAAKSLSIAGKLRKVILTEVSNNNCTISVAFGSATITSSGTGTTKEYSLSTPTAWGNDDLIITIKGNANGAACEISSIAILTGTDDSETSFAFPTDVSSITNNYITFNSTNGTFSVVYDTNVAASQTLTYLLQQSEGRTIKYASSNTDIATVDENTGVVTLTGTEGQTVISATPEENDNYYGYGQNAGNSYTINVYQSYGFTIAGSPVSSNNASDVFGDGTVSFAPADNKLTLNNATIDGPIVWSKDADLTIILKGSNRCNYTPSDNYAIKSTHSKKLYINSEQDNDNIFGTFIFVRKDGSTYSSAETYWSGFSDDPVYEEGLSLEGCDAIGQSSADVFQISYGLTVAGVRITGNNGNITGDGISGKVTFSSNATVAEGKTAPLLTLENATITGEINWSKNQDLYVKIKGECHVRNSKEWAFYHDIYGSNNSYSSGIYFQKGDDDAFLDMNGEEYESINSFYTMEAEDGMSIFSVPSGNDVKTIITSTYGLSVAGFPIHDIPDIMGYKEDVLDDDGSVTFVPAKGTTPATLMLTEANINGEVYSSITNLRVYLKGSNIITAGSHYDFQSETTIQHSPFQCVDSEGSPATGTLVFDSSESDAGELTVNNAFIFNNTNSTWTVGGYTIQNEIKNSPSFRKWVIDSENKHIYLCSVPSITVANNAPSSEGSITGDGITSGTVTFVEANNYDASNSSTWPTLTLTGANISGGIEWNPIDGKNLLIVINGKNMIENSDNKPAISTDNSVLLLEITKGSDSGDASFKIRDFYDDGSYYAISGFSNSTKTETLLNGLYQLKLSSPNGVGRDNYTYISNNSGYETYMTIGYYTVHNIPDEPGYMENVFGDDGTPTVEFEKTDDGGVLTLNNASINGNVKSAIDHLKVYLIGSSDMTGINSNSTNRAFYYSGEETAASLTFDSTDEDAGQITFHNIHEFVAIAQGYSITPNLLSVPSADGWAKQEYYDSEKQSEQCVVLLKDISYNVSVNGVPVTKSNANNIDGTGIVFTPADETEGTPATLTLNAASFTTSGQNAFESGLENLTVLLEGENIITCGGNSDKLFKGTVSGAKVTFAVGNTSEGRLGGQCLEANMFDGITPVYPEELIYTRSGDSYLIADVRVDLSGEFKGNNNYATFCEEQSDVYPKSDITPFVVTGVSGSSVTLQALSYIPKGVPVILGKTKNTATSASFSVNKLQSAGYEGDEVTASSAKPLYVLYNDQFVKVTDNTAIHRGKCYLELSASAGTRDSYSINAINDTSAIEGVRSEGLKSEKCDDWFDLQGRRIDKPTAKGLYIQSGKKVVIR